MKILITGVNGQDGINMVNFLSNNNNDNKYQIFGSIRSNKNIIIDELKNITIIELNISNYNMIEENFIKISPDIIIHFAAEQPQIQQNNISLFETNTLSIIYFLEIINKYNKKCKFFSSGSSMEFGSKQDRFVNLNDICYPDTIYGISKFTNRYIVKYYRDNLNIFAVHCTLFSHESIYRKDIFFTKKIIINLIKIKKSLENNLPFEIIEIGNLFSKRDWSDSRDFIKAIWLMMNKDISDDYILSSGTEHTIKEFIDTCCECLYLNNCIWKLNSNELMELYCNDRLIIVQNKKYMRDNDFTLIGDNSLTKIKINWNPEISFKQMILDIIKNYN